MTLPPAPSQPGVLEAERDATAFPAATNTGAATLSARDAGAPPRRRRVRPWVLVVLMLLALPVFVCAIYWMMLRAAAGDYLFDARGGEYLELRAGPLPVARTVRWGKMAAPTRGLAEPYLVGAGRTIVVAENWRAGMPSTAGAWDTVRAALTGLATGTGYARLAGTRHYLEAPATAASVEPIRLERFRADDLKGLPIAMRDGDVEGILKIARRVREREPRRATPIYWEIASLCALGRRDEAVGRYAADEEVLRADPTDRGAWYCYLIENDLRAATDDNRAALRQWEEFLDAPISHAGAWPGAESGTRTPREMWEAFHEFLPRFADAPPPHRFSILAKDSAAYVDSPILAHAGIWVPTLLNQRRGDDAAEMTANLIVLSYGFGTFTSFDQVMISARGVTTTLCPVAPSWIIMPQPADWIERLWERLEVALPHRPRLPAMMGAIALPSTPPPLQSDGTMRERQHEVAHHANARAEVALQLFREALRARHYRGLHGDWPEIGADGALAGLELTSAEPPLDPYADPPAPLRARREGRRLVLHSIGPDRVDDRAPHPVTPFSPALPTGNLRGDVGVALYP